MEGTRHPAWSFAHRPADNHSASGPGPGSYSVPGFKPVGFALTSAVRSPPNHISAVPGPGAYYSPISNSTGFRFSSGHRLPLAVSDPSVPGPGAYSLESPVARGPMCTFAGRYRTGRRDCGPGPGDYSVDGVRSSRKWSFGRCARGYGNRQTVLPGPGEYDIPVKRCERGGVFGKETRRDGSSSPSPGPGAYNIDTDRRSGFSITSRSSLMRSFDCVPGPGAYNPSPFLSKAKGLSLTTASRSMGKISTNPGPGTYDPVVKERVSVPGVRSGLRRALYEGRKEVPGPGTYQVPEPRKGPEVTMKGRRELEAVAIYSPKKPERYRSLQKIKRREEEYAA